MSRKEVGNITIDSNGLKASLPIITKSVESIGVDCFTLKMYIMKVNGYHYFELEDAREFRLFRTKGWKDRWGFSGSIHDIGEFITSHIERNREIDDKSPDEWVPYSIFAQDDKGGYYIELITRMKVNELQLEEKVRYDFYPVIIDANEIRRMVCQTRMDLNEMKRQYEYEREIYREMRESDQKMITLLVERLTKHDQLLEDHSAKLLSLSNRK
jgi:hypothetical protein